MHRNQTGSSALAHLILELSMNYAQYGSPRGLLLNHESHCTSLELILGTGDYLSWCPLLILMSCCMVFLVLCLIGMREGLQWWFLGEYFLNSSYCYESDPKRNILGQGWADFLLLPPLLSPPPPQLLYCYAQAPTFFFTSDFSFKRLRSSHL